MTRQQRRGWGGGGGVWGGGRGRAAQPLPAAFTPVPTVPNPVARRTRSAHNWAGGSGSGGPECGGRVYWRRALMCVCCSSWAGWGELLEKLATARLRIKFLTQSALILLEWLSSGAGPSHKDQPRSKWEYHCAMRFRASFPSSWNFLKPKRFWGVGSI